MTYIVEYLSLQCLFY